MTKEYLDGMYAQILEDHAELERQRKEHCLSCGEKNCQAEHDH